MWIYFTAVLSYSFRLTLHFFHSRYNYVLLFRICCVLEMQMANADMFQMVKVLQIEMHPINIVENSAKKIGISVLIL